jgi:hypothetical protein
MSQFNKYLLSFPDSDQASSIAAIRDHVDGLADTRLWGVWTGLFGIASDELIVVTTATGDHDLRKVAGFEVLERDALVATVRPTTDTPLSNPGFYVFRSLYIDSTNIDEVVELSRLAWQTFETSNDYQSEPIGLFAPARPSPMCTMYLVTWYDGLGSWVRSRVPAKEAQKYFRKRRALIHSTKAVATRLMI